MSGCHVAETPWYVVEEGHKRYVRNRGGVIAFGLHPHRYDGQNERFERELAERKRQMHLIAAAPDQHAALIEVASAIEDAYDAILTHLPGGVVPDWFVRLEAAAKQSRAAIAKATGVQPC